LSRSIQELDENLRSGDDKEREVGKFLKDAEDLGNAEWEMLESMLAEYNENLSAEMAELEQQAKDLESAL